MRLINFALLFLMASALFAADSPPQENPANSMSNERLASIITRLDDKVAGKPVRTTGATGSKIISGGA